MALVDLISNVRYISLLHFYFRCSIQYDILSLRLVRLLFMIPQASVKGPRCRYFPGSKGPALPICKFSLSRPITAREERLSRLRMLREQEMVILREGKKTDFRRYTYACRLTKEAVVRTSLHYNIVAFFFFESLPV